MKVPPQYFDDLWYKSNKRMKDFDKNMTQYWADEFPKVWSFLWSPEEAQGISAEHKDQIHFLNKEGTRFLNDLLDTTKMTKHLPYHPFKDYFGKIDTFEITNNCEKDIKKWLYGKEIPFSKYVYIDSERSGQSVMLTWKMVIKYWKGLFFSEDIFIFDSSLEWAMFYYHENELYFGTDIIYNVREEERKLIEVNKFLTKYAKSYKDTPQ